MSTFQIRILVYKIAKNEVLYDVLSQGASKLPQLEDLDFPLYLIKADFLGLFNLEFW